MLTYLYHALASFRNAFSRERSGLLFRAVVLSFFSGSGDDRGDLDVPVLAGK